MIELLGAPTTSFIDKLKNITFAFFIMVAWVYGITILMGSLGVYFTNGGNYQVTSFDIFAACIIAPAWEETIFRWAPIEIAKSVGMPLLPVILISSVVFGLGHRHGIHSLLVQGVMGFMFSLLYIKNNYSIWTTMLLHAMWNGFVFLTI